MVLWLSRLLSTQPILVELEGLTDSLSKQQFDLVEHNKSLETPYDPGS